MRRRSQENGGAPGDTNTHPPNAKGIPVDVACVLPDRFTGIFLTGVFGLLWAVMNLKRKRSRHVKVEVSKSMQNVSAPRWQHERSDHAEKFKQSARRLLQHWQAMKIQHHNSEVLQTTAHLWRRLCVKQPTLHDWATHVKLGPKSGYQKQAPVT